MRLSEAIRRGAKMRKQVKGKYFQDGGSCAMGAAWEGQGGKIGDRLVECNVTQAFSILEKQITPPRKMSHDSYFLETIVVLLNDIHGWSREAIAEWVETVEDKLMVEKQQESEKATKQEVQSEVVGSY